MKYTTVYPVKDLAFHFGLSLEKGKPYEAITKDIGFGNVWQVKIARSVFVHVHPADISFNKPGFIKDIDAGDVFKPSNSDSNVRMLVVGNSTGEFALAGESGNFSKLWIINGETFISKQKMIDYLNDFLGRPAELVGSMGYKILPNA